MILTEKNFIENYSKLSMLCDRNTFLPYGQKWNCTTCEYNVIRRNNELTKEQREK